MFKNIFTQTTKKFSYFLITIILVLGLSISAQSLLAAWTTPTASPPSNNISPPITEGSNSQVKAGTLGIAGDFYVNTNTLYVNSTNGRVGIGTSNPNRHLHIYDTSVNAELDIQSVAGANNHWAIYNDRSDNSLRFWHGDNRLTILSNGNVGIGMVPTLSSEKLEVADNIRIKGDHPHLVVDANANNQASYVTFYEQGVKKWSVGQNGYFNIGDNDFYIYRDGSLSGNYLVGLSIDFDLGSVGIGKTNPSASYKLDVAGGAKIDNNIYVAGKAGIGATPGTEVLTVGGNMSLVSEYPNLYLKNTDWGGDIRFILYDDGNFRLFDESKFRARFENNGNVIFCESGGNVGIGAGAVTPTKKLDIDGDVRIRTQKNCSKLYTDANGNVQCGTDQTGGISCDWNGWRDVPDMTGDGCSAIDPLCDATITYTKTKMYCSGGVVTKIEDNGTVTICTFCGNPSP